MTIEAVIRKRLGKNFLLDVAFETNGGLGILGPSGCGKSMTLKCIAGIETPDSGHIVVNGRTLFDSARGINVKPQERRAGYLFQHYALFPKMTVERNICAGIPSGKDTRRIAPELLRRFHLEGMEKRYPDQLSGGQRQRVALARMLAANPEVILLDEPLCALDSHLREQMQMRLLEIFEHCRDTVMVTHNRDEAYKLCAEMLVLRDGGVAGKGKTRELFDNPGELHIARVTGCKNFSRMKKTGPATLRALDWNLDLVASGPIPDDASHVGVRAHDLVPVHEPPHPGMRNLVEPRIARRSEDPFEWTIIFTNANAPTANEPGEIWWKFSKRLHHDLPPYLHIPPAALLILRDAAGGVSPSRE